MNKTISINLGGRNFFIEEDAYKKLDAYLSAIKARFAEYAGSAEIVADMESRIGEKFGEKFEGNPQAVITIADVDNLISELGTVEDIAGEEGAGAGNKNGYNRNKETSAPKRLMRNSGDKIIAGVCSGLAAYFDVDPIIFRVGFVVLIFAWGAIIPIYFVLWLIMPEAKTPTEKMEMRGIAFNLDSIGETIRERSREFKAHVTDPKTREEWKKWGEDMKHWDVKKNAKPQPETQENVNKDVPPVKPAQENINNEKSDAAAETVKSPSQAAMPEAMAYQEKRRGGFGNFLRQIFRGLGRIILFVIKLFRRLIGVILIVAFALAIAGVTVSFAVAIFNANSPYIGLPIASLAHTPVFYLLLVVAYVIVFIPLQLLLLAAVSLFSGGRTGMNVAAFSSLFGVWVLALVVGGAVGARYVPGYIEQIKNSPQLQNVSKNYDVNNFDKVVLENSISYKLVQGNSFSVKASGWATDLNKLNVSVNNGTLTVSRSYGGPCIFCISGHDSVEITAPDFTNISATNSSDVSSDQLTATSTSLSLSNSSTANINFTVKELDLDLSNSSTANLTGTANTLSAKLHNSSDLNAKTLLVNNADITTANSSEAHVNISQTLKFSSFNSSQIYYTGNPQITTDQGAGSFEKAPEQENQ